MLSPAVPLVSSFPPFDESSRTLGSSSPPLASLLLCRVIPLIRFPTMMMMIWNCPSPFKKGFESAPALSSILFPTTCPSSSLVLPTSCFFLASIQIPYHVALPMLSLLLIGRRRWTKKCKPCSRTILGMSCHSLLASVSSTVSGSTPRSTMLMAP